MTAAARGDLMSRDHFIYRAYDEAGRLLYVGVTRNWRVRWNQHCNRSAWAKYTAVVEVTGPLTYFEAFKQERLEIRDRRPFFNVEHRPVDVADRWGRGLELARGITAPADSIEWARQMDEIADQLDVEFSAEGLYLTVRSAA